MLIFRVHISMRNGAPLLHIPDGFLDVYWITITYLATIGYFTIIGKRSRSIFRPEKISTITTIAAIVFVAQMFNWPIPGGTSLHFLGSALAGIILGPALGSIALALVLVVQALVFHDGGITTLGANILNMAIIGVLTGYATFRFFMRLLKNTDRKKRIFISSFMAGWISLFIAGIACGVEIGLSPRFPYGVLITIPVMGIWHLVLGVVEGIITGLIVLYVYERNPHLVMGLEGI